VGGGSTPKKGELLLFWLFWLFWYFGYFWLFLVIVRMGN
jgi:hypothetical protein